MRGKFLKTAADEASLQRQGSKVTNHSVRKTSIGWLLDANTPETFVAQLSGHKNRQGLQSYKSANEHYRRQMSYILSGSNQSQNGQQITAPSASNSGQLMSSTQQSHSQLSLQHTTNSLAVNNASVPAASNGVFPGANISTISGCQFQIFNGPMKLIQQGKKRRYVIESDDWRRLTFIANVTENTASSPHVFKIQSQTRPIFALTFKLSEGQTLVNTGQNVLWN